MQASNAVPRLNPTPRWFLSGALVRAPPSRHRPLGFQQPFAGFTQMPWIVQRFFVRVRQGNEVVDPQVNTHCAAVALPPRRATLRLPARSDVEFVHQHGGIPAVAALGDGDRFDDPAAALQCAVQAFGRSMQAHRPNRWHLDATVGYKLNASVEGKAAARAALFLKPWFADRSAGTPPRQGFQIVFPRGLGVSKTAGKRVNADLGPPR